MVSTESTDNFKWKVLDGEATELRDGKISTLELFDRRIALYQNQQFADGLNVFETGFEIVPEDVVVRLYQARCQ